MTSAALPRDAHRRLLSRLVWPVTALAILTLTLVGLTIAWTTRSANDAALAREQGFLATFVEAGIAEVRARAGELATAADSARSTGPSLDAPFGFAVVGPDGAVRIRTGFEGPPGAFEARLAQAAHADPDGLAAGRLLFDGARATLVAAAAGCPSGLLVAFRRLGDADLLHAAGRHGLRRLALARTPVSDWAAFAIPGPAAGSPSEAYLVWQPDRPGDDAQVRLVPMLAAGGLVALLLFGLFLAAIQGVAGDLAAAHARAQSLVGRDPLSGLPNRLLFAERLDQELSRTIRTGEGVGGPDAGALARRILDSLTQSFLLNGATATIGVSIGIALAPSDGTERETLMRLADTALYQAKSEGRNRFRFFARAMDETIRLRKLVEDDLRRAIKRDELVLHYQPIYAADGATLVAVEALVRWPHPEHGMVSPAKFIAVAEERGLVIPLGEWVLRRACRDAGRWPGIRLAVNVSPIQFHHRDFVASVMRATRDSGFDPANLEIELTEGVLVDDEDAAEAAMVELRALGVNLALDDFGTGYSSLIYLRRFAFDTIKIDRSFLESMEATGESAILVHSIVHLGRALGLTVTAEGVETREQHRFLQALGCHQLQGFLFSPPVPADVIDGLVGDKSAAPRAVA